MGRGNCGLVAYMRKSRLKFALRIEGGFLGGGDWVLADVDVQRRPA